MRFDNSQNKFRCIIHGSFGKHFEEIKRVRDLFSAAGVEVLAPKFSDIVGAKDGFALFEGEEDKDPRMIELLYLHNLKKLGENGFSYFVNPEGYIGRSASYELGIAQISNVRCFFSEAIDDHPAYIHKNSIWKAEDIVGFVKKFGTLPEPKIKRNERAIHRLWQDLMAPGSVVAVGGIIEYQKERGREKEVLLVKTHKWGGQYSIIGGKVRRNERLEDALIREIKEESGLRAYVGENICAFDQIKDSGYYVKGIQHIFIDKIARVENKRVRLNEEAEDYIWMPVKKAIEELPIEPNALHTLKLYDKMSSHA